MITWQQLDDARAEMLGKIKRANRWYESVAPTLENQAKYALLIREARQPYHAARAEMNEGLLGVRINEAR